MNSAVSSGFVPPQLHGASQPPSVGGEPLEYWGEESPLAGPADLVSTRFPAASLQESIMVPLDHYRVLCVVPGQRMPREQFEQRFRADQAAYGATGHSCAVALDGILDAAPFIDLTARIANLDHHKGVSRINCPCSACQAMELVSSGALDALSDHGRRIMFIYAEDGDLDVVLGEWSLENAELLRYKGVQETVRPLFELEDRLDRWCGASAISPNERLVRQMAWINEPFVQAQRNPLFMHDAQGMARVICEARDRVSAFVFGVAGEADLNTRYQLTPMVNGWGVLREYGYYARALACSEGLDALLSVRGLGRQRVTYNLFRTSPQSPFPIEAAQAELNRREAILCNGGGPRLWGGAKDMFTASPRTGTLQTFEGILDIIRSVVGDGNKHS
ncbi:MAG: hypothetical protein QY326_05395 [Bdellovibrionota bacterium]|nr:MAG: hypothetical protein QY326_05395 [Bdellovibrionota bacterium]